ncbi:hypothetical protein Y032_0104g3634 [Ancylostoma ceylanicum]|uniref:Uncharacterized protein n=1 Tax=Ancylostoma ceylanicum TaxID=53326 RepID=A0A016TGQ9_9BILA|nr:hypothetical protein Y032_0104g3634 [Ancylostoma ceylanicum]
MLLLSVLYEHIFSRSKLCVLQLELMDKKKKQKVLDTVHDVFPKSVPLPTPESTKQILKWHGRYQYTCFIHSDEL